MTRLPLRHISSLLVPPPSLARVVITFGDVVTARGSTVTVCNGAAGEAKCGDMLELGAL